MYQEIEMIVGEGEKNREKFIYLFIYFSFFNIDTFSSNILLIKITIYYEITKFHYLIVKRFNCNRINQYNPEKE